MRDEHLKIVSAFANTEGRKVVIGISYKGKAISVRDSKKFNEVTLNKIRNILGMTSKVSLLNLKMARK